MRMCVMLAVSDAEMFMMLVGFDADIRDVGQFRRGSVYDVRRFRCGNV